MDGAAEKVSLAQWATGLLWAIGSALASVYFGHSAIESWGKGNPSLSLALIVQMLTCSGSSMYIVQQTLRGRLYEDKKHGMPHLIALACSFILLLFVVLTSHPA